MEKEIEHICRASGDPSMMHSSVYYRTARYFGGEKLVSYVISGKAFYYGIRNKTSFRLIAIAVAQEYQGQGIGSVLVDKLIHYCAKSHLKAITLRTHKSGKALGWWRSLGAVITGEKGEDYEMRIQIKEDT